MDKSNPAGKSRTVTCRFYKKSAPSFVYRSYRSLTCWDDCCHHYQGCVSIFEMLALFSNMPDSYYAVPPSNFFASLWRYMIYCKVYSVTGARSVILKGEWYGRPACLPIALFLAYLSMSEAGIQAATKVVIWKVTPQIYQLHNEDNGWETFYIQICHRHIILIGEQQFSDINPLYELADTSRIPLHAPWLSFALHSTQYTNNTAVSSTSLRIYL